MLVFKAYRGETIGIIGGTGSGKSSLVNLIPRFYDATKGQVLVSGKKREGLFVRGTAPEGGNGAAEGGSV